MLTGSLQHRALADLTSQVLVKSLIVIYLYFICFLIVVSTLFSASWLFFRSASQDFNCSAPCRIERGSRKNTKITMNPNDTKDFREVNLAEHNEESQAKIKMALAAGAKGHNKSADVAMKLFENHDFNMIVDPAEQARVVKKVDWFIIPMIAVNYIFFYIDKTTLSYAALYGIREDLNLTGQQYSWLSSIFYFGFMAWAFPTNFLMQKFPLGKYLGFNIILWGVFLMLQAACSSFATLAVLRFLSGAAEACADPAFMLITQMWYTRYVPVFRCPTN